MVGSKGNGIVVSNLWFPFLGNQHPSGKGIKSASSLCCYGLNYIFYSDHYFIIIYLNCFCQDIFIGMLTRLSSQLAFCLTQADQWTLESSSGHCCELPDLFHTFAIKRVLLQSDIKAVVNKMSFKTRYQCFPTTLKFWSRVFDLAAHYSQVFL